MSLSESKHQSPFSTPALSWLSADEYAVQNRRNTMEDRVLIDTSFLSKLAPLLAPSALAAVRRLDVYAVFDGHLGSRCADYALDNVQGHLMDALVPRLARLAEEGAGEDGHHHAEEGPAADTDMGGPADMEEVEGGGRGDGDGDGAVAEGAVVEAAVAAVREAIMRVDEEFCDDAQRLKWKDGSCALVMLVINDTAVVANTGDCRAVLVTSRDSVALSSDHTPGRQDEHDRVLDAGGEVRHSTGCLRCYPHGLAVSRSLGDVRLKRPRPILVADPEIEVLRLDPSVAGGRHQAVILATDGIWGRVSNRQAADVVRRCRREAAMSRERAGSRDRAGSWEKLSGSPKRAMMLNQENRGGQAGSSMGGPGASAASELANTAIKAGSTDNIGVIVLDITLAC